MNIDWSKYVRILNKLSSGKIILYGSLGLVFMVLILFLATINPLKTSLEANKNKQLSLKESLVFLQTELTGIYNQIPDSSKLPDILDYINESLQNEKIIIEGIQQNVSEYQDNLNQAVVKVAVLGETAAVIEAAEEIIQKSWFPVVLEEFDTGKNTVMVLRILYRRE